MTNYFQRLAGQMIEAVLDRDAMPDALKTFGTIAKAPLTELRVMDRRYTLLAAGLQGPWPEEVGTMEAEYRRVNPRLKQLCVYKPGRAVRDHDVIDRDEINRNETYQDFIFKLNLGFYCGVALANSSDHFVAMVAHRHKGKAAFDDQVSKLIEQAVAACQPAFELSMKINRKNAKTALELLGEGANAVLLSDKGKVLDTTEAFEKLCADKLVVVRPDRTLDLLSRENNSALLEAIQKRPIPSKRLVMRLGPEAEIWLSQILPCPRIGLAPELAGSRIVHFESLDTKRPIDTVLTMEVFGLTRAEAETASLLFQGMSIAEIAEERGTSVGTVRGVVKTILTKTDCNRQASLVAKLSIFRMN